MRDESVSSSENQAISVSSSARPVGSNRAPTPHGSERPERPERGDAQDDVDARRFRATVECAPVGIAHVSPEGRWLWVNDQLCALLGYTREELLAAAFQDITHPEDLPANQLQLERLLRGEQDRCVMDNRYVRQDGSFIWAHLTVTLMRDATGQQDYFIAVIEDISQRKQAAEASAYLAAIVTSSTDAIISKTLEGIVTSWNASAERMFGYSAAEMIGQSILRLIPDERCEEEDRILEKLRAGETIEQYESVRLTKDGRRLWVSLTVSPVRDASDVIIGASKIARDITERKRLEHETLAQARQLEAIFAALTDGLVVYDASGYIVHMNTAAADVYEGASAPEYTRLSLEERATRFMPRDAQGRRLPREDWPQMRVLRGEELAGANAAEVLVRTLDGRDKYLSVTGGPLRNATGAIVGAVLVLRDVSERTRLEEERSHLLSVVGHEIGTPLTTLKAREQLLRRQFAKAPETPLAMVAAQHLTAIQQAVAQLERQALDLRTAAHAERGDLAIQRAQCNVVALCREVVDAQRLIAKGRTIQLNGVTSPIIVDVDNGRLVQVLTNLLTNAIKYSPADRPITVSVQRHSGKVTIAVRDRGQGIPPEALPRLFDRFYRGPGVVAQDTLGPSLGLGLYIARTIVERLGGTLSVQSALGKGSTFRVTLPVAPDSTDNDAEGDKRQDDAVTA